MSRRHYIIYCDESAKRGPRFSNFYAGAIVKAGDRQAIESRLTDKKEELNLKSELKWTKITENYEEKYIEFINEYFSFIASGRIKFRLMFTQNIYDPVRLTKEQRESQYFLLYYQMIKHAFGLKYSNPNSLDHIRFSVFLDELPDKSEKSRAFKRYISSLGDSRFLSGCNIELPPEDIAEIDSRKHNIIQGVDIILGAMQFRLNGFHKAKPEGKRVRGKRTRAKERVYEHVNRLVRDIRPNFNIGITSGSPYGLHSRWRDEYRHWCFRSTRR